MAPDKAQVGAQGARLFKVAQVLDAEARHCGYWALVLFGVAGLIAQRAAAREAEWFRLDRAEIAAERHAAREAARADRAAWDAAHPAKQPTPDG